VGCVGVVCGGVGGWRGGLNITVSICGVSSIIVQLTASGVQHDGMMGRQGGVDGGMSHALILQPWLLHAIYVQEHCK
jgi:hypothetical protein